MKRFGIHFRLMIAAFLLISAATLSLDMVGVQITRRFMHKRFQDRVTFLAKYLALNAEVGVLIGDRDGLRNLAMNMLGEEDVSRVTIFDNQDSVMVDLSRAVKGPISFVEYPVVFQRAGDENLIFGTGRVNPFTHKQAVASETIGKVRISFSTYGISQLMADITRQFLWTSFALVFVAAAVFFFLSRSIVLEVRGLVNTASRVADGEIHERAPIGKIPETAELARVFNVMLDSLQESRYALERANQEMVKQRYLAEMGEFSLIIAHEVKNPLGIIKSSLDILKRDAGIEKDNLMVSYMEDEIQRLNLLIEEFLSFARPKDPRMREVELNEMLREVVDRFDIQQGEDQTSIDCSIPPKPFWIEADKDLLSRAVGNIVKNAIEADGEQKGVRIHVNCHGEAWLLDVEDEGDGIQPEHIDRIFEPFFTTRSKGTGLGLAFASQVIEKHGGNIHAENRVPTGARFRIRIPRQKG